MSWIKSLFETYNNNISSIGKCEERRVPLLLPFHSTSHAHVCVTIDENGNFVRAEVIGKGESRTIIPVTEESAGRTLGVTSHPLCDKLQYVAGDYLEFGGDKKSGYMGYLELLKNWRNFDPNNLKLNAVLSYTSKGHLISDLVNSQVLFVDPVSQKTLLKKWTGDNAPAIFQVLVGDAGQIGTFVRWRVESSIEIESDVWKDSNLMDSWSLYSASIQGERGLCYVTGLPSVLAKSHPMKIRNDKDRAKLISSNGKDNFTFRGQNFISSDQVCGVSCEVTQKAHSALRWLISRQGWQYDGQVVVAWSPNSLAVPNPLVDTEDLLDALFCKSEDEKVEYTAQEVAIALANLASGYYAELPSLRNIVVMSVDAASPGRLSICFYRELEGSDFLDKVSDWHKSGCWKQNFSKDKKFYGVPSPKDIAECAYGQKVDSSLKKATIMRILPCIVDGIPFPSDLVNLCVKNTCKREILEEWESEKYLGIACSVYKQKNKKECYQMSLETERKTRDYLYGRLLALAERLENYALYLSDERRATNAERYMYRFSDHPYSTWLVIWKQILPYRMKLAVKKPSFLNAIMSQIDEVQAMFTTEDFVSDGKLSGEFLLGYHCQREALWKKSQNVSGVPKDVDQEENVE
jgi:CRISPR-associated protein Csd1